jgi:hypothetical protein
VTRTVRVVGGTAFAVWVAVAALAVLDPDRLSVAVPLLRLRADTTGALGYLVAAAAFACLATLTARSDGTRAALRSALWSGVLLSGGGWLYIAGNAFSHPQTLGRQLTHFAPRPLEREFGIVCLVVFLACAIGLASTRTARA